MPRKTFKHKVTDEVGWLQVRCSSDGRHHVVSRALWDAMEEIMVELLRPRTNWKLVAALTGVKSWICSGAKASEAGPFWSKLHGVDGPYYVLDGLHHDVSRKVQQLPSGMSEYTADGARHGGVDTSVSPTSPTLRLIAVERAALDARAAAEVR